MQTKITVYVSEDRAVGLRMNYTHNHLIELAISQLVDYKMCVLNEGIFNIMQTTLEQYYINGASTLKPIGLINAKRPN